MQDATQIKLGSQGYTGAEITDFAVDPASFPAGLCVSMNSSGLPSLLKSDGIRMGVSMGRSLADVLKTAVLRTGLRVPIRAELKRATGLVTVTSFANLLTTTPDTLAVAGTTFTAQSGAATLGTATFRAATSNAATATSIAVQINAHATANTKVMAVDNGDATVSIYSLVSGAGTTGTGNDIAVVYTDNGGGNIGITLSGLSGGKLSTGSDTITDIAYMTVGAKIYVNDVSGKLDANIAGFTTIMDGVYMSTVLTGITEDGSSVAAADVDLTGGL